MKISDTVVGAGFVAAGALIFTGTLNYPTLEGGHPGPSLFPRVLALLMVGFGACLVVPAMFARLQETPNVVQAHPGPGWGRVVNAFLVFAAIIVFILVSQPLGFLLTTLVILFGLMWWLGTPVRRAVLAAAGLTLFVYVIFGKILRVPLPLGLLWF